ncbi:MAG: zinc ribbon domain-containing protein [Acidobacteriota bacterium]
MSGKAVQCKQVFVKLCTVCGAGVLADNQFCRQCGAQQDNPDWTDEFSSQPTVALAMANDQDRSVSYATTTMDENFYHAVSTPLIKSATEGLTSRQTGQLQSQWSKTLVLALILLPIWLMIMLLSPLDAYLAAKASLQRE